MTMARNPFSVVGGVLCLDGRRVCPATIQERNIYIRSFNDRLDDIHNHIDNVRLLSGGTRALRITRGQFNTDYVRLRPRSIDSGYSTDHSTYVEFRDEFGRPGIIYHYNGWVIESFSHQNADLEVDSSAEFIMGALDCLPDINFNAYAIRAIDEHLSRTNTQYLSITTEVIDDTRAAFDALMNL